MWCSGRKKNSLKLVRNVNSVTCCRIDIYLTLAVSWNILCKAAYTNRYTYVYMASWGFIFSFLLLAMTFLIHECAWSNLGVSHNVVKTFRSKKIKHISLIVIHDILLYYWTSLLSFFLVLCFGLFGYVYMVAYTVGNIMFYNFASMSYNMINIWLVYCMHNVLQIHKLMKKS